MTAAVPLPQSERLRRAYRAVGQLVTEVQERSTDVDIVRPTRRGSWWYAARIPAGRERVIHGRRALDDSALAPHADSFWNGPVEIILDEGDLGDSHLGSLAVGADVVAYTVDPTGAESFDLIIDGRRVAAGMAPDVEVSPEGRVFAVSLAQGRPARAVSFHGERVTTLLDEPTSSRWIELDWVGDRLIVASRSLGGDRITAFVGDRPIPCAVEGAHVRVVDGDVVLVDGQLHHWSGAPLDLGLPRDSVIEGAVRVGAVMLLHLRVRAEHALGWVCAEQLQGERSTVRLLWSSSSGQTISVDGAHGCSATGVVESLVSPPVGWVFDACRRTMTMDPPPQLRAQQRRVWVTGGGGERIPVTLANKEPEARVAGPLVLLVYGAYGVAFDARFSPGIRSLLDRGVTLAIAHVRGGGELGPGWHAAATGQRKLRSVDDYLAVAHHLIDHGWTERGRIVAQGSSAGGTIVAAALNREPALFAAALVHAPFVDPLAALSDNSARAAVDFAEWGDPEDPRTRRTWEELTAADGVRGSSRYPPVLAFAGLNDPRVPAEHVRRWVDAVKANGADAHVLIDDGGHDGAASRRGQRERFALELAWTLDVLGIALDASPR